MATIKVHIISTSSCKVLVCFSKPRTAEQLVPSLIIKSKLVETDDMKWNSGTQGETPNVMLLYEKKKRITELVHAADITEIINTDQLQPDTFNHVRWSKFRQAQPTEIMQKVLTVKEMGKRKRPSPLIESFNPWLKVVCCYLNICDWKEGLNVMKLQIIKCVSFF